MSKRYIDTGLFDDDWFMDLSKDCKILYLYLITKCSHAGLIKINERLCKVQTGISDLRGALEGLRSRLIEVQERLYFMPKFLYFQYPKFPQSKVFQQRAALEELTKLGLFQDGVLVPQEGLYSPSVSVNADVDVDVEEESEEESRINISFTLWWDAYEKKVGPKEEIQKKWECLKNSERVACMSHTPGYVKSTPDKQFRMHPQTYLNQRGWENEIIEPSKSQHPLSRTNGNAKPPEPSITPDYDPNKIYQTSSSVK